MVNVAGPDAEFRSTRWIRPDEFNLAWLPPMKRQTYRRVLQDFFATTVETRRIRIDARPSRRHEPC
jgi:hypothetical protein